MSQVELTEGVIVRKEKMFSGFSSLLSTLQTWTLTLPESSCFLHDCQFEKHVSGWTEKGFILVFDIWCLKVNQSSRWHLSSTYCIHCTVLIVWHLCTPENLVTVFLLGHTINHILWLSHEAMRKSISICPRLHSKSSRTSKMNSL